MWEKKQRHVQLFLWKQESPSLFNVARNVLIGKREREDGENLFLKLLLIDFG